MNAMVPNIPGQPHKWAEALKWWADGGLVQWRYAIDESKLPEHLQLKPGADEWRDCNYPSLGEPNWFFADLEFRIVPGKASE